MEIVRSVRLRGRNGRSAEVVIHCVRVGIDGVWNRWWVESLGEWQMIVGAMFTLDIPIVHIP